MLTCQTNATSYFVKTLGINFYYEKEGGNDIYLLHYWLIYNTLSEAMASCSLTQACSASAFYEWGVDSQIDIAMFQQMHYTMPFFA